MTQIISLTAEVMINKVKYMLVAVACFVMVVSVYATPAGWEQVRTEQTSGAKSVMRDAELEIKAAPLTIIVTNTRQTSIKVFTILGRLVSTENLPAGTSRLQLPAHGVYIVKVGDLTCKVAI